MIGTISRLMDKGYGFIQTDNGDIFFHATELEGKFEEFDSLEIGMQVEFELAESRDGKPKAIKVRIADEQNSNEQMED